MEYPYTEEMKSLKLFVLSAVSIWCIFFSSTVSANTVQFDAKKLQDTWLSRTNAERKEMWANAYIVENQLVTTATQRSDLAKTRGYISHERKKWDGYYNYAKIEKWFAERNIRFQNIQKMTFSESIGRGYVKCPANADCTEALIKATKSSWSFFMSEKNKKSQPHYKAIVNKNFTMMWVGVSIDPATKKYYLTVHYWTKALTAKK